MCSLCVGAERAHRTLGIEQRKATLASYGSLDDDRLAATLNSLRDDDGFATLPADDERLVKREIAQRHLDEAIQAEAALLSVLSDWGVWCQAVPRASSHSRRLLASLRGRRFGRPMMG